ncbi:hypothetical protein CHUAL_010538 [Chamberlinius hualienensis]
MMLDPSMDTSFYSDDPSNSLKMRNLKRMMTLDFNSGGGGGGKRGKLSNGLLLSSPDLNMLKLGSPELENLLIQQHGQVTTTPTPQQFLYPKTVTEEQELYARGFVDALNELHQNSSSSTFEPSSPSNSSSDDLTLMSTNNNNNNLYQNNLYLPPNQQQQYQPNNFSEYMLNMNIKEEPQTVPNGSIGCSRDRPPLSPIDLMAQERIKLERKRQRNRLAATKCRKRKLERIARLEDKVQMLKDNNSELGVMVVNLKEHVCHLKEQLMQHVNNGCQVLPSNQL